MAKKRVSKSEENASTKTLSFEQAMDRLEQTVARLEDGQLGLDESLAQYEKGIQFLRLCYQQLEKARRKIELLAGIDENGEVRSTPFEESAMSLEEKQAARSQRRSRSRGDDTPPAMDDGGTLF
jgi:exodeoxyribonuclease VII small subunit